VRPLADVRVISVEQYGAGPFATLQLADLGADIVKIEDPATGGDVGRYVPPYNEGEDSLFFESFNRNKHSLSLDIRSPAGREVFEDLVRGADAVFSNLRGDVPEKLRIRYADLKHINPRIVCCSLTGFGMTGPRAAQPGYDYVLQGLAGWMDITGEPGGPPTKSGLSLVDFSGGLVAAISLLAGLHRARRDGVGLDCDVSLYETAVSMLTYPAAWHLNAEFEPVRTHHSAHPSLVPFQAFEASDGWIVVGCAKEKFWQRLVEVLGRPDLAADPAFATFADRQRHADVRLPQLEAHFRSRTMADNLEALNGAGVPSGPVNSVGAALVEPQTVARDLIVETEHPRFGRVRTVATAVRVGDEPPVHQRAPARNEDFDAVVTKQLGYSAERIEQLRRDGAFGVENAQRPAPALPMES
jgi:crotonobetainyl-CoA:carnitine CoA-transferase CaiB-like acyl-CoA transferase